MQMDLGVIMKVACVLKENLFIRTEQLNSKVQLIGPSCVTVYGGLKLLRKLASRLGERLT